MRLNMICNPGFEDTFNMKCFSFLWRVTVTNHSQVLVFGTRDLWDVCNCVTLQRKLKHFISKVTSISRNTLSTIQ